jgi:hypothetical protein
MLPPLVNVTSRIMLDKWAANTFMPTSIDDNSCTLLFKAVIKNLQNQEFAIEAYPKIKLKCLSYLSLNSKDCPETVSDDDLLEDENSPLSLYTRIHNLIEKTVTHKRLLFNLCDTRKKWEGECLKESPVFSINDAICTLKDNPTKKRIVYTETQELAGKMRYIKTLTLTYKEFEQLKKDNEAECISTIKKVGEVGTYFNYSLE